MADRDRVTCLEDLDQRYVWHPFTQMREWNEQTPLIIERAEGNYLIDAHGQRYLDGVASLWVNVHGHNRPEINEAIVAQLHRVAHTTLLGLASPPAAELAAQLVALAPGNLTRVFYSDSGSTAVEIALKQAFQYWQHRGRSEKRCFAHLQDAYHGDTLGAVGVGGIELFHQLYAPLIVPGYPVPTPHRFGPELTPDQARVRALAALEAVLIEHGHEIAACIVEPLVQGAAGMIVQPPGYLQGVAALCRDHDVLLIADEVATGFGRTGTLFACEQEGVEPDLLCLAKGLSGGYLPLAATLATEAIYEAFLGTRAEAKTFYHGHTFTGNPLACAAALASLELFETDGVLEQLPAKIDHLQARLRGDVEPHPRTREIRQKGLMVGIDLRASADEALGARVCQAARSHGVIIRPLGDVVVLMPPLSITLAEIDVLVGAVARALRAVCG